MSKHEVVADYMTESEPLADLLISSRDVMSYTRGKALMKSSPGKPQPAKKGAGGKKGKKHAD